jgi:hypothetical protein
MITVGKKGSSACRVTRLLIKLQEVPSSILYRAQNCSLLHGVRTGSGIRTASYLMSTDNHFQQKISCCLKLTTHLHAVPKL